MHPPFPTQAFAFRLVDMSSAMEVSSLRNSECERLAVGLERLKISVNGCHKYTVNAAG